MFHIYQASNHLSLHVVPFVRSETVSATAAVSINVIRACRLQNRGISRVLSRDTLLATFHKITPYSLFLFPPTILFLSQSVNEFAFNLINSQGYCWFLALYNFFSYSVTSCDRTPLDATSPSRCPPHCNFTF